jgi:hypothetical protein
MKKPPTFCSGIVLVLSVALLHAGSGILHGDVSNRSLAKFSPPNRPLAESVNCRLLGGWPFGPCHAVAVDSERHVAFCGDGPSVCEFDVTSPSQLVMLPDSIHAGGLVEGMVLVGERLYVAAGAAGFQVWDVSSPGSPSRISSLTLPGPANGVAISGNRAYVADGNAGLRILDIADAQNPTELGHLDGLGFAWRVAPSGDFAYLVSEDFGLRVIDVTDPGAPVCVWSYRTSDGTYGVAVCGNFVYVVGWNPLWVFDVSDPYHPGVVRSLWLEYSRDVTVRGSYAYVAGLYSGWHVLDLTDPSNPTEVGQCGSRGAGYGIAVAGTVAYVAEDYSGLQAISVSDPHNPFEVARYGSSGQINGVAVHGDYAYVVAAQDTELRVLDISDPQNPIEVGQCHIAASAGQLAVGAGFACVACAYDGLRVVDVSDPRNPFETGHVYPSGASGSVALSGSYAYVAATWGLWAIDFSNPRSPSAVGFLPAWYYSGLAGAGNLVCLISGNSVMIVDVSNPRSMSDVVVYLDDDVSDVAVSGDYVYIAEADSSLLVFDASVPSRPVPISRFTLPGPAWSVAASSDRAWVADDSTLFVLDVGDPHNPVEVGYHAVTPYAQISCVAGNLAYVTTEDAGLRVYEYYEPPPKASVPPKTLDKRFVPAVARGVLAVNPSLPAGSGQPEIALYDAKGRRVTRLGSGSNDITGIPAGIYFCRLTYQSTLVCQKVVLTR